MSAALSLSAAERLLDDLADAFVADALTPAELAPLLRGHAREDDGAAFALCARLGLGPAAVARILPEARKIAGA